MAGKGKVERRREEGERNPERSRSWKKNEEVQREGVRGRDEITDEKKEKRGRRKR